MVRLRWKSDQDEKLQTGTETERDSEREIIKLGQLSHRNWLAIMALMESLSSSVCVLDKSVTLCVCLYLCVREVL